MLRRFADMIVLLAFCGAKCRCIFATDKKASLSFNGNGD